MGLGRGSHEILAAARGLFEERGVDRFTMQELASRAGVSKTSIYKRWRTKEEILIDLLWQSFGHSVRLEDTGTTLGDIQQLTRELERAVRAANAVVSSVVSSLTTNPELRTALRSATTRFHKSVAEVFDRGVARGDLDPSMDVELATLLVIGPFSYLIEHQLPVSRQLADRIARLVHDAFRIQ